MKKVRIKAQINIYKDIIVSEEELVGGILLGYASDMLETSRKAIKKEIEGVQDSMSYYDYNKRFEKVEENMYGNK